MDRCEAVASGMQLASVLEVTAGGRHDQVHAMRVPP
jgi:hypothetical protein